MEAEHRKAITKMLQLKDTPSSEDGDDGVLAYKKIPQKLVDLVDAMEIGMGHVSKQRGVRWENIATLAAPFIMEDMKSAEKEESKVASVKGGTALVLKRGNQKLKGTFIKKDGDKYVIQLAKDDEPISVDPAKVII